MKELLYPKVPLSYSLLENNKNDNDAPNFYSFRLNRFNDITSPLVS